MKRMFKNKKVSDELRKLAISKGLCKEWQSDWNTQKNIDELCDMFIKGIKFCAFHRYPSPEYLEEKFGDDIVKHGIYANRRIEEENPKIVVGKGTTSGNIIFNGFSFGIVHALDQSTLNITVKDNAIVWVYVYNNACVTIDSSSINYVRVHRYEGEVTHTGKVDVRERRYNPQITNK